MIEKNINKSLLRSDSSVSGLIRNLEELDQILNFSNASIYHHFPFYRDDAGESFLKVDLLFVSNQFGIVIFAVPPFSSRETNMLPSEVINKLNQLDSIIFSKLIKNSILQESRRQLKFNITPVIYLHNYEKDVDTRAWDGFQVITTLKDIRDVILNNKRTELSDDEYKHLKASIEGSRAISILKDRSIKRVDKVTKGAILQKIEAEIANYDLDQKRAAMFILDGPQRIRGLAGSGKTIILTMKAALIHLQYPEAVVLYTYYTKSLYDLVKRLITKFYRQYSDTDPNWDKIHILHAWGGVGLEGVYYNTCVNNGVIPLKFVEARRFNSQDPFGYICEELNKNQLKKYYDYSLLDEAQDFPQSFYRVCRQITRDDKLVWAYDDFQNILDIEIQNEKETFGKDDKNNYFIDFSRNDDTIQDIVLHKCYRNTRETLLMAFSLGLGIYNDDGKKILQRLENNTHWEDLGFQVLKGSSSDGDEMVIVRPEENSPVSKNEFIKETPINFGSFKNLIDEVDFIIKNIKLDIEEELLPEDICVICLDSRNASTYFEAISEQLEMCDMKTFNLLNAPSNNTIYKVEGHITLSTIYRAKGNEAGSVYVIGVDAIFSNKDSIIERNKLFTAITRSTGWVSISGIKPEADICIKEIKLLAQNEWKLKFLQPSKESTRTILRDINLAQEKLNKLERYAEELSKELGIPIEDVLDKIKIKLK